MSMRLLFGGVGVQKPQFPPLKDSCQNYCCAQICRIVQHSVTVFDSRIVLLSILPHMQIHCKNYDNTVTVRNHFKQFPYLFAVNF